MPICKAIIKTGKRVGLRCTYKTNGSYCGTHSPSKSVTRQNKQINKQSKQTKQTNKLNLDKAMCGCGSWPVPQRMNR